MLPLQRVIVARFVLLCLFPAMTYSLGFVSRYDNTSGDRVMYDRLASFLLTAMGGVNSLVLIATEKATLSLLRGDESLSPNGFSGVVKNLGCHSVPGVPAQHLPSDRLLSESDPVRQLHEQQSYDALTQLQLVVVPSSVRSTGRTVTPGSVQGISKRGSSS